MTQILDLLPGAPPARGPDAQPPHPQAGLGDGAAGRRTRDRILDASRALFNVRGPGAVTTAEIAAACGISEGNLHYHFRRKEMILEALFAAYEQAVAQVIAAQASAPPSAEAARAHLAELFALIWEWRCIYDRSVLQVAPEVGARVSSITDRGQAASRARLRLAAAAGWLRASDAQIEALVVNTWIVSTYWIDYLRSHCGVRELTRAHLDLGLAQVEALFAPYLAQPPADAPSQG